MLMDRAYSSVLGPRLRTQWREGAEYLRILPRRSSRAMAWALLGLVVGSFREWHGITTFLADPNWFDDGLMAAIVAGWGLWLIAAVSEYLGTEIVSVQRGELIVSRGIGPLRRTFRYRVAGIAELVASDPLADPDAKPTIHHIYFKAKSGAVRFEYGDKTVYFAETLDEAGGEAIVRWLMPRLPRSASEMMLGLGYRA